jgi:hypothetical protein
MASGSASHFRFYNIFFESLGGFSSPSAVVISLSGCSNIIFEDCRIWSQFGVSFTGTPTAARDIYFRRCIVFGMGGPAFSLQPAVAAATANADLNINIEHCLVFGDVRLNIGTSAGNKAGGVRLKGSTFIRPGAVVIKADLGTGTHSTVTPSTYEGCTFISFNVAAASDAGALVDNGYNRAIVSTGNSNVTVAGTTKEQVFPNIVLPDLVKWGLALPTDQFFAWTQDADAAQRRSGWSNTDPDFRGRTARPWGGGTSIGYLETPPVSQDTGSAISGGGANSLKIAGAGEQSLFVPVNGGEQTTITISTESSGYGGTNYPQLIMEANPALGVSQATASAVSVAEQTLTIGPFTPTADGVVELRLISRSTSGASATYFDLLAAVEV